jgi:hypothetical protein
MIRKLEGAEAQAQLASEGQLAGGAAKTEGGE